MNTYTVLIREVVTTHRRVTIQAISEEDAAGLAVRLAASGGYKHGEITSRVVDASPLLSTLEAKE